MRKVENRLNLCYVSWVFLIIISWSMQVSKSNYHYQTTSYPAEIWLLHLGLKGWSIFNLFYLFCLVVNKGTLLNKSRYTTKQKVWYRYRSLVTSLVIKYLSILIVFSSFYICMILICRPLVLHMAHLPIVINNSALLIIFVRMLK